MKNIILSLIAICSAGFIAGCSCDNDKHCDNTSASYDNKDMHARHHHMDNSQ